MRPAGLEPTTYGSGGRRSIQLNYGRRNESKVYAAPVESQLPKSKIERLGLNNADRLGVSTALG